MRCSKCRKQFNNYLEGVFCPYCKRYTFKKQIDEKKTKRAKTKTKD